MLPSPGGVLWGVCSGQIHTHGHSPPSKPMPFPGTGYHRMHCVSVQTHSISHTWETVCGRKPPSTNPEQSGLPGKHLGLENKVWRGAGGGEAASPGQPVKACNEKDLSGLPWPHSWLSQANWGQAAVLLTVLRLLCKSSFTHLMRHSSDLHVSASFLEIEVFFSVIWPAFP